MWLTFPQKVLSIVQDCSWDPHVTAQSSKVNSPRWSHPHGYKNSFENGLKALQECWRYFLGSGESHILIFPLGFPTDRKTGPHYHKWKPKTESSAEKVLKDLVPRLPGLNYLGQSVDDQRGVSQWALHFYKGGNYGSEKQVTCLKSLSHLAVGPGLQTEIQLSAFTVQLPISAEHCIVNQAPSRGLIMPNSSPYWWAHLLSFCSERPWNLHAQSHQWGCPPMSQGHCSPQDTPSLPGGEYCCKNTMSEKQEVWHKIYA